MSWSGFSAENMIQLVCRSALHTNNLPWTLVSMKPIFWMAAPKSLPQKPSLRHCLPSATLMGSSMSCLMPLWITGRIPMWSSLGTIRSRLLMVRRLSHTPPEVGSCVVSGRMTVLLGRSCQTLKSLTLFGLLASHLPQALLMNQPSTSG